MRLSRPAREPPGTAPIRLLIADDHLVVRDGLNGMFAPDPGSEVLGQAADGAEAVNRGLLTPGTADG
jgi:DNA-binding NarL/FixJ family response regulator